eukprot:6150184-Prymnesium_polylepis.1
MHLFAWTGKITLETYILQVIPTATRTPEPHAGGAHPAARTTQAARRRQRAGTLPLADRAATRCSSTSG